MAFHAGLLGAWKVLVIVERGATGYPATSGSRFFPCRAVQLPESRPVAHQSVQRGPSSYADYTLEPVPWYWRGATWQYWRIKQQLFCSASIKMGAFSRLPDRYMNLVVLGQ